MTEDTRQEWKNVRMMIRIHLREVSPVDVLDIQQGINVALAGYPDAEVETSMLPLLPAR